MNYKKMITPIASGVMLCLLVSLLSQVGFAAAPKRPNILLIMVDDMGWSDIGCYGAEIKTPNIDALAANGIRFRQFYNTSKCFTTRACLLSGIYAQQNGLDTSPSNNLRNAVTLGEVLGSAGYHTYASGKNHALDNLYDRGFEHYYGLRDGACNHFNPGLQRSGEPAPANKGAVREWADDSLVFDSKDPSYQGYFPPGFYSTDAFTSKAQEYLTEWDTQDTGRPFFLYLAYTAPHDPIMAHPADIAKYDGIYDAGYETIRTARYQKQITEGLITSSQYPLSPGSHRDWGFLNQADKNDQARRMQVYAAMIDRVDQCIGGVITQLQQMGAYDDTLILFCSDNGAATDNNNFGDLSAEIGGLDYYTSLQRDWANVGNTPFRFFKNNSDEGGIRTPLVAHWPNGITNPGRFADKAGHVIDFMATFADITGAEYPSTYNGERIVPLQGESFADVLYDQPITPRSAIFFDWGNAKAVIDGGYKLIQRSSGSTWKLFNLNVDGTEATDIAAAHPALYNSMLNTYNTWFDAVKSNEAPTATDDTVSCPASSPVTSDILANDLDGDGSIDRATLTITRNPAYGSVVIEPDGSITYTPGSVITASMDRFAYNVRDNDGELSNEGLVVVDFSGNTPVFPTLKIEAEDATVISAAEVKNTRPTASGGEFINFNPADPSNYLEWNYAAPSAGDRSLTIRYALAGSSIRRLDLMVNGLVHSSLSFPATGSWDVWGDLTIPDVAFLEGTNTIRVSPPLNLDGPNLDYLEIIAPVGLSDMDTDNDGILDLFEDRVLGLDKNNSADALQDLDGDGENNLFEYAAGTDLLSADSKVNLRLIQGTSSELLLEWDAIWGVSYDIYESGNLSDWILSQELAPQSGIGQAWIPFKPGPAFFRLKVK